MEPGSLTRPHLDDGELLCLLDGEADAAAAADGHVHLAHCAACRARLERYRTRRDRLAALLAASDFAVPASTAPVVSGDAKVIPLRPRVQTRGPSIAQRPWLRAAAVILLLVAAAAVATPARAWIISFVSRQWTRIAHDSPPPPQRTQPPARTAPVPAPVQASAQVRFVPTGGELRVSVAHAQTAGTLTLVAVDGDAASAEVLGGQPIELLVVPTGLRIRNAAGVTADYRVQVPAAVRRVRVRIASGREIVVDRDDITGAGRTIPLTM